MARRLDLLVPCYNEGEEVIRTLLDSVAVQRGVELSQVGVVVCCDGGTTVLTDEFMSQYPFHIEFHMCEHRGVSATRNECLSHSDATLVMFCDVDDAFIDTRGMYLIRREMNYVPSQQDLAASGVSAEEAGTGFDYMICDFVEESIDKKTGQILYVPHSGVQNMTFVHGSVFRRQWLVDNDIRFCDKLSGAHEDSYFICLARAVLKPYRARVCNFPFYGWLWRDESTCRRSETYILETYGQMLESNSALCDELSRRMLHEQAAHFCASMIYDAFYNLTKRAWTDIKSAQYRSNVLEQFKEYYRHHRAKWHSVSAQEKLAISNGVRSRCIMEGDMQIEPITIEQWLVRLGLEDESYIADSKTYL